MAAIALLFTTAAATMAQGSFAYQAVIRTADGKVVSNQKVGMRFTLLSDGTSYYSEVHTPTTNEFGNISVMIGSGTKESGDFMNVPWSKMNLMLKIEVDAKGGTNYTELGQTQLLSVPYAMYAQTAGKVEATQKSSLVNEPIFEVKDKDGNLVFAVYPDGVKVYVDDTDVTKAKRSGFVVTGRSATKDGESADYFAVNAEGTQVFIDDTATSKAKRSGFVVTGRSATKDSGSDYFKVTSDAVNVSISSFNVSDKTTSESVFAIKQGNVQVNSDLLMTGEVGKVVDAEAISDSIFTINLVGNEQVVATIDMIDPDSALVDGEYGMYALLRITDNSYVPVYEWDSLMFDARGYATTNKKSAVVSVRTTWDGSVVVNPLQKDIKNFTAVFGLTWTRNQDNVQESFVFKKVMIVSENQSQGQGQGGNQSQVQGGFYGVEKGHMIINTIENGESHQFDYYFLDYGNKEYYTFEEDGNTMIYYTDWKSTSSDNTKEYIYLPEKKEWAYYTKEAERSEPLYYFAGDEDYAADGGEINGLRTKLYTADGQQDFDVKIYVYEGIRVRTEFNDEVTEKIESFDFNSDVQDFFEWAKGQGYQLPGNPE